MHFLLQPGHLYILDILQVSKTEEKLTELQEVVPKNFANEYRSIFKQLQEDIAEMQCLYKELQNQKESLFKKECMVEKDNEATKKNLDKV